LRPKQCLERELLMEGILELSESSKLRVSRSCEKETEDVEGLFSIQGDPRKKERISLRHRSSELGWSLRRGRLWKSGETIRVRVGKVQGGAVDQERRCEKKIKERGPTASPHSDSSLSGGLAKRSSGGGTTCLHRGTYTKKKGGDLPFDNVPGRRRGNLWGGKGLETEVLPGSAMQREVVVTK